MLHNARIIDVFIFILVDCCEDLSIFFVISVRTIKKRGDKKYN